MVTFSISKELVVTLKYYYEEKKSKRSKNYVEMFAFQSPEVFLSKHLCKSLRKIPVPESFQINCQDVGLQHYQKIDFEADALSNKHCRIF